MAQISSSLSSSDTETLSQVLGLVEAFRAFDSDNDGFITEVELGGILGSLGYNRATDQDVRAMMHEGDRDCDGLLSLVEFLEMNTKTTAVVAEELFDAVKSALDGCEFDCGESVTAEELFDITANAGVEGLSFEDCERIVGAMDADGDGAVSFHDFQIILSSIL